MAAPASRDFAVALAGGLAVAAALRPTSGQDSNPPTCWNTFGMEVPCDGSGWPLAAAAVAALILVLTWLLRFRHRPGTRP